MAQPQAYNREVDFTERDGDDTNHAGINAELDGAALSINQIRDNLALIQRDDGGLQDGVVTAESLAPSAFDAVKGELNDVINDAQNAANSATLAAVTAVGARNTAVAASESAGISASNATASAANAAIAAQTMFNGLYQGASATDPVVDLNGQPLNSGDFYYNTTAKLFRVYDETIHGFTAATPSGQLKRQQFVAGVDFTPGVTAALTAASDPVTAKNIFVFFDAAVQHNNKYTLVGNSITFTSPIPVGVGAVEIAYLETIGLLVPADDSVTNDKVPADAGIESSKLAYGSETVKDALDALHSSAGASFVGYLPDGTGAVATDVETELRQWMSAKSFAKGDNATDDRLSLIAAMAQSVALGKTLYVPDGTYLCSNWIPLPSGLKMVFSPGAVWKLTANTSLGGFVCGGYDADLNIIPFSDVDIYGIRLDCNNLAGENGFNAINASGVRIHDPKIYNTKFSGATQGGKAFQFEGATVDGLHVFNPYIENCTIGINSHSDPAGGTEKARHISYYNVVMRNVDVPFNVDGQFTSPETGIPDNMSTFVHGANLYNCGKLTLSGSASDGGGIVCGDRGYGLKISGLRVVNSAAYGGIGGLVRGTLFNIELTDAKIEAPSLTAIYNFEPVGYGSPSVGVHPCTIVSRDVTVIANLDYVVKGFYDGKVGKCLFDNTIIDSSVATLSGVCDLAATTNGLGVLDLALADLNYKSSGRQSLAKLFASGNTISVCHPEYEEGEWTPTDASGAGLSFTLVGTPWYMRRGRLWTGFCAITYPVTADASNAMIGGFPVAASLSSMAGVGQIAYSTEPTLSACYVIGNTATAILSTQDGTPVANSAMSGDTLYIVLTYMTA